MATNATLLPRTEDLLERLDRLLARLQALLTQQRADPAGAALLKQMPHAQTVLANRRSDLRASLDARDVDRFTHELWSLGGDMAHFDIDLSRLAGADAFARLREEISPDALVLTQDLTDPAKRAASLTAPRSAAPWTVLMAVLMAVLVALLAGCAAGPPRSSVTPGVARDGPEASPPPDLARVPDAEPKLEPIRNGGPNKPYDVLGKSYVPITRDAPFTERGLASWYGRAFQGRRTASGEIYNMYAMTAAHPTLPIPSYARVRNPANGREVVLRINDRGPFHAGRIVDLSYTAALKLDLLRGVGEVELQRITSDDIRTGAWRRGTATELAAARTPEPDAPAASSRPAPSATPTPSPEPTSASTPTPIPPAAPTPAPADITPAVAALVVAPPVADAPSARAFTAPARGFWVQLGAFRQRDGAEGFRQRVASELDWLSPLLAVFSDAALFRLQAGPYPNRDDARAAAERIREALRLVPVIVERR